MLKYNNNITIIAIFSGKLGTTFFRLYEFYKQGDVTTTCSRKAGPAGWNYLSCNVQ